MMDLKSEKGSITLEAAMILPFFLAFVLTMLVLIQISIAESTLSTAVSELTAQVNTHMYPADLLYQSLRDSNTGKQLEKLVEQLLKTRELILSGEESSKTYAMFIPDSLLEVIDLEKRSRESFENGLNNTYNQALNLAFHPLLAAFIQKDMVGKKIINPDHIRILKVTLPNLENHSKAFFGIEAQYEVKLPIPFIKKTINIQRKAMERSWVGS